MVEMTGERGAILSLECTKDDVDGDGDGDGDATTTGTDDSHNDDSHNEDGGDGHDYECSTDPQCSNGICEHYYCREVDELPSCDSPESLVELPIPEQLDGVLRLAMGDVDDDGDDDILAADSYGVTAVLDDLTVFSALGPWQIESMTGFELDGDGSLDLAVWQQGSLELYAGDGAGNFVALEPLDGVLDKVGELARFDADGDGDDDLIAQGSVQGSLDTHIAVWVNEGGVITPMPAIEAGKYGFEVADFGSDGRDEFVAQSAWSMRVYWYGPPWDSAALEGMGACEGLAAVQHPGTLHLGLLGVADRYPTQLLHSWTGKAPFPDDHDGRLRMPGDAPLLTAGDFDGDGWSSGFAYGGSTESLVIRLGLSMAEHCYGPTLPNTERAVVGDVDGDHDDELAIVVDGALRLYGDP